MNALVTVEIYGIWQFIKPPVAVIEGERKTRCGGASPRPLSSFELDTTPIKTWLLAFYHVGTVHEIGELDLAGGVEF